MAGRKQSDNFIFIAVFTLAVFAALFLFSQRGAEPSLNSFSKSANGANQEPVRILFVGNSYTFFHDMPDMVVKIADGDPGYEGALEVHSITEGGATLAQQWQKPQVQAKLAQLPWDFIVLQEQSMWAMLPGRPQETAKAAYAFAAFARKIGAKPVFYGTWARKPGSRWYADPQYKGVTVSAQAMQQALTRRAQEIAGPLKMDVVDVGEYFMFSGEQSPHIELYDPDGSHPSLAGSYLTALLFYTYFTGRTSQATQYIPAGLEKKKADVLKASASFGKISEP